MQQHHRTVPELSPELAFIVLCLRCRIGSATPDDFAVASARLDWRAMVRTSLGEGLGPLVFAQLRDTTHVDPAALAWLEQENTRTAAVNLVACRDRDRAVATLRDAGIEVRVVKGAALIGDVYESVALRPMTDIDLYVRGADVDGALATLAALGYRQLPAWEGRGLLRDRNHAVELAAPPGPLRLPIDLHWRILRPVDFSAATFENWAWKVPRTLGPSGALGLRAEAALLNLLGHADAARSRRWRRLHDLAEFMLRFGQTLNWEEAVEQAHAYRLDGALQRGLQEVHHHWGLEPAPEHQSRLPDLHPAAGTSVASRRLDPGRAAHLQSTRGWQARMRLAWAYAFPSREYMEEYYGARGLRGLARSYVARLLGRGAAR